ncbi:MAG TPA: alpha/beta fold hydrolase [Methanocella sp.]|nr:alpha/beta fold hydrolase [Methanocella sp.]
MEETILLDGINVNYQVEGKGNELLLIHGLGSSHKIWKNTIRAASRFFKVYAPDLPGFGRSDKPNVPYGVQYYVDLLGAFMDKFGIGKASIAGASMGGAIAAAFTATHPDRVVKLVLADATGLTPLGGVLAGIPPAMGMAYWLVSLDKGLLKMFGEGSFYDRAAIPDEMIEDEWANMKDSAYRNALARNAIDLSRVRADYADALRSIRAPTLIIWGRDDRIMPVSDAQKYRELISGSAVVILDKCGHVPAVERSEEFNKALLTFLCEIDLYYADDKK